MDALSNVPQPVILGLAGIGAAWAAVKVGSFVRVLLSLFILPGISVRISSTYIRAPNC